jgi:hypothetical protein
MRNYTPGLTLAGIAALLLTACGGGGGSSSSSSGGTANVAPIANAGSNQTVTSGDSVTLNGTASRDSDGTIASYTWTQTVGTPSVTLTGGTTSQPTFPAPTVATATTLTFSLVVTDNRGATSPATTVNVTVNPINVAPTANAGSNQTLTSGVTVTLNGSASSDPDGSIASYTWTQTAGTPAVTLANGSAAQPTFVAPTVAAASMLTFSLVVTDNLGAPSPAATVSVTVNPAPAGNVNVTGQVKFARVPFQAPTPGNQNAGLNYASPVQQPSRGVMVEALAAGTTTVLATATTDDAGNYTLAVASNTSITIRVTAKMQRTGSPQWDVRVQDGVAGTPYSYTQPGSFNSSSGSAHNVAIPTGISAAGVATGARASGPFAVLDTIYQGIQTILGAVPTTSFPALIVDWGSQTDGTFFSGGGTQHIALLADLTEDTDEFDQHVIAHEFGHYIEFNFSRADNIGGAHGYGDKLDPRVAFGEGFGYAFAAIVLNDPVARDSFVNGTTQVSGGFNVEDNPPASAAGAQNNDYGCWCSESSVWSILWDVYDNVADANDTLALGFTPIWNVLTAQQRNTPAFTTIFTFITGLKAQNPGSITAINTLVAAQNINATNIDLYGTNETHSPTEVPAIAALPVYALATIGGPDVVVRTVDDAGRHNKLGDRRFVRFTLNTTRDITITARSSNPNTPDTDFSVYRNGLFVRAATNPPAASEQTTLTGAQPGEYLIDLYDCANGCDTPEGTPGDYDLTVTVN